MAAADEEKAEIKAAIDAVLPTAQAALERGNLRACLEHLARVEKQARQASDAVSTARVAVEMLRACWTAKQLDELGAQVQVLSKKRSQMKRVITDMVQTAMEFTSQIEDPDARRALLDVLRAVTEGKIYLEVERARLTKTVAAMMEAAGDVDEASRTLQEVAVETYGAMDKKEKAEYLLEQVRLCLAQGDLIRTAIIARKVSKKTLEDADLQDVRVSHYRLLVELHGRQRDAAKLAEDWDALYATPSVRDDEQQRNEALSHVAIYAALAPWNEEAEVLVQRLLLDRSLKADSLAPFRSLLQALVTKEVAAWPLDEPVLAALYAHKVFSEDPVEAPAAAAGGGGSVGGAASASAESLALRDTERCWWDTLQKRLIQHNLRVLAGYYSRVRFDRLCQLVGQPEDVVEATLAELVCDKSVYARIDRPGGVVSFQRTQPPAEVLSQWGADISDLLSLVERTTHLINKELMTNATGN